MRAPLFLLFCLLLSPSLTAQEAVRREVLPNGLTVIVRPFRAAPVVAVQAWVRAGSVTEGSLMGSGLSHYFEHMLYKGTQTLGPGDFSAKIRACGGADENAYTTYGRTVYHFTILSKHLESGFGLLADIFTHATFDEEETRKEQEVILREFAMGEDDPDSLLWDDFSRTLYRVHPYRHPVIGYRELFNRLSRQDILEYYERMYSADNIVLVVVGDIDPAQTFAQARKAFSGLRRRPLAPLSLPSEPEPVRARHSRRFFELEQTRMTMGVLTTSATHPDTPALDLLATLLGDGRTSRLVRDLREERQIVHNISVSSWTPAYPGVFEVSATLEDSKRKEVEKQVHEHFERLRTQLIEPEELERARVKILSSKILNAQTADSIAGELGWNEVVAGDVFFDTHYRNVVSRVTPEDLQRVAKRYLQPHRLVTSWVRPRSAASKSKTSTEKNRPRSSPEISPLPGGGQLILHHLPDRPLVHLRAEFPGGVRHESIPGASSLMTTLLTAGSATRNREQIARAIESLGGSISSSSGRDLLHIEIEVLRKDFQIALETLSECVRNASFPETEIGKERKAALASLARIREDPWTVGRLRLREILYGGHPYSRNGMGTEKSLQSITRGDLIQNHQRLCRPEKLVLAIYGDFDRESVRAATAAAFDSWSPPPLSIPKTNLPPEKPTSRTETVSLPGIEQAIIRIAFPGVPSGHSDGPALAVLEQILDGFGSRLVNEIREKRGLAYSVGAYTEHLATSGSFGFYAGTEPDKIDQVRELMETAIEQIRTVGPTEQEVTRAQLSLRGAWVTAHQTPADLAAEATYRKGLGQPIDAAHQLLDRADTLTAEQIREVAARYFIDSRRVLVVVRPKR